MTERSLRGLRIGVFGKGGAGKSTITTFLAFALQEAGYSAVVVDADSTNHGLAAALGADREPDPLLDYFGGMVFSGGFVTCPVDDPTPLQGARLQWGQIPARFVAQSPEGIRLLVAGKLGGLGPGAGCDGPVAKIARDLRIEANGPNRVMLLDFKAGFEDAARGALTTVDWAIVAVDPTTAAPRMARHLAATAEEIRRGTPPATQHLERPDQVALAQKLYREARIRGVLTVLSRIPTPATEAYLRAALHDSGAPVAAVFPADLEVGGQWLQGERLQSESLLRAGRALGQALERTTGAESNVTFSGSGGQQ